MAQYKGAAKEAGRAMMLIKKRQKELEEIEVRKRKIEEELKIGTIHNKFAAHYDAIETKLKSNTVGLVTLNEMRAKQEDVIKERERQIAVSKGEAGYLQSEDAASTLSNKIHKQKAALSFTFDDGEEEDDGDNDDGEKKGDDDNLDCDQTASTSESIKPASDDVLCSGDDPVPSKKKKLGKNPDVDTSFLPDRDREEEEARLREELRLEWVNKQEKLKSEEIDITYSYWDGSGHRRQVRMRKGSSIHQFLQKCLEQLRREFNELKTASVDQLMYVKEDLIVAHHYTFYDFIVTKARGKSGPLFNFDVHDDVRIINDALVEKDESHAGKVCLRVWYERNKHIFPASRWEPYDPEKSWDKYTVSDKEAAKITVK